MLKQLKDKARKLKSELQILVIAYKDSRTPVSAKLSIWITVGYLLSPIDLIPDFIPVLGLLDDIIIVPALIALSIKLIPKVVLVDARQQAIHSYQQPRKTNWVFALLIIVFWLLSAYFIVRWLYRLV